MLFGILSPNGFGLLPIHEDNLAIRGPLEEHLGGLVFERIHTHNDLESRALGSHFQKVWNHILGRNDNRNLAVIKDVFYGLCTERII